MAAFVGVEWCLARSACRASSPPGCLACRCGRLRRGPGERIVGQNPQCSLCRLARGLRGPIEGTPLRSPARHGRRRHPHPRRHRCAVRDAADAVPAGLDLDTRTCASDATGRHSATDAGRRSRSGGDRCRASWTSKRCLSALSRTRLRQREAEGGPKEGPTEIEREITPQLAAIADAQANFQSQGVAGRAAWPGAEHSISGRPTPSCSRRQPIGSRRRCRSERSSSRRE